MATVHAATASQKVLDRLVKAGATDLRKNRSVFNNIILTSTGAAKTLELVIPEMKQIGFIAESVRIPSTSGSLIILVVNFQEDLSGESIRKETINRIYRETAEQDSRGYLLYTEEQNVSGDVVGTPSAGAIIEGHETHTRTASIKVNLDKIKSCNIEAGQSAVIEVPVTQAVIYGWYDNELGSYTNMLGDLSIFIADRMV